MDVERCIDETMYQKKICVASAKQGVAFKKMMCYVLSVQWLWHLWHLHNHGGQLRLWDSKMKVL
jgi:hypothetical protein